MKGSAHFGLRIINAPRNNVNTQLHITHLSAMLFDCFYFFICKFKVQNITINWCMLCDWRREGKSSRSEASFRDCMTHVVLSTKKPSARRPMLLQDRAAGTARSH